MTSRQVAERLIYVSLIGILLFSYFVFIMQSKIYQLWEVYNHVYFLMLLVYTWFIYILLFVGDRQPTNPDLPGNIVMASTAKVAVIVPCYNEQPQLLYKSIRSVLLADGNKEVIVIDDGSTIYRTRQLLLAFARKTNTRIHFFSVNKGKRHALYHAVKHMINEADYVVTIDSDTVLTKDAITNLIKPFANPRVGATTGDIRLLNEKQNLLTRMVAAYYWIGLHIYKQAQSNVGMVVCCSGCLAAYRALLMKEIIDEFVDQRFFGEPCTHSEDRHLTNLILRGGHLVKFTPDAISYTATPASIRGFLRQQQRWKRGFIRESIYTLTYAWRVRPLLFIQILLWELTIPFFSFGLMLMLVSTIFLSPMLFFGTILPTWIVFMFVRYMPIFFYGKRKIPGLFIYMLFYEVFLYWQSVYALFTVRNKSWMTR